MSFQLSFSRMFLGPTNKQRGVKAYKEAKKLIANIPEDAWEDKIYSEDCCVSFKIEEQSFKEYLSKWRKWTVKHDLAGAQFGRKVKIMKACLNWKAWPLVEILFLKREDHYYVTAYLWFDLD